MFHLRPTDIRQLQNAIAAGKQNAAISLDLGLTKTTVELSSEKLVLDKKQVPIPTLKKDEKTCFVLLDDAAKFECIRFSGDTTGQIYELVETAGRPMLKVSATPFHKWDFIKRIEKDAEDKKIAGIILDAGTGLGYTAIAASRYAKRLITIEFDEHIIEVQKLNPWSKLNAPNIECEEGDVCEFAFTVPDSTFDVIILDGGTPRSSGNFFSLSNYQQMRRILKSGGVLYHYLPEHGVTRGRDFPAEVIKRMKTAGFSDIQRFKEDNYVVAR